MKEKKKMTMKLSEALKNQEFKQKLSDSVNKVSDKLPQTVLYKGKRYTSHRKLMHDIEKDYKFIRVAVMKNAYDWKLGFVFSFSFIPHNNDNGIVDQIVMFLDKKLKYFMLVFSIPDKLDIKNIPVSEVLEHIKDSIKMIGVGNEKSKKPKERKTDKKASY